MGTRSLTSTLQATLALFSDSEEPLTTTEVAERLDLGRRATYGRLERLVENDRLETKKVGANARVWWRPTPTDETEASDWPAAAESLGEDVLDDIEVGIFVLDENFEIAWINEATERYFGLDRGQVLGRDKRKVIDGQISTIVEDSERFAETVLATYDDNTYAEQFECHITAGPGRADRWLEHRSRPIESGAYAGGRVELYHDVTRLKQAERARRREYKQFEMMVDTVEEYAIFMLDREGYVQTWNSGAERIKKYDRSEIVGSHFSTFYTEADRKEDVPAQNLERAAAQGWIEEEGWRVRSDGSTFWASVTITAIHDDDGDLQGYAKVTRDMTDRREREQKLREEKAFNESILDNQRDLVYAFDTDRTLLRYNDRFKEVTGYAESVIDAMEPEDLVTEDETDEFAEAVDRVFDHGETVTVEHLLVTAEGEEIPYEFTGGPIRDQDGTVVGLTGTGRDVSDRKERERRLERQREDLKSELDEVFERIEDGFLAIDENWRYTFLNDTAEEFLGRPEAELTGRRVWETFSDTQERSYREEYERAMETQTSVTFEEYSEAAEAWLEVSAYPSENGLSVYFKDISERKRREKDLELYENIVETVWDGVYALDDEEQFVLVNEAFCDMVGYEREQLIGRHATLVTSRAVNEAANELESEVLEGECEVGALEHKVETANGETVPVETRFGPYQLADGTYGRCGVCRDVSERKERERELETRIRQQRIVTNLGQRALEGPDLDVLMSEAVELVAETLDNDYCKVLDLDEVAEELLLRQGVGWTDGLVGEATVSAVEADSQAAYTLESDEPVTVTDLETETRFSGPDLLTDHRVRSGISVVIGSPDDPWGVLGTHDTDVEQFSEHDANFVQSVANILSTAIDRHDRERQFRNQREQLAALNNVNRVVQDITDAVIDQSSREEIEQTVCERLAAADSYLFAWIGEVDIPSQTVTLRTEAGVEDYLDEITISIDPDDARSYGATGRAIRTGEIQTTKNVQTDARYEPWRDTIEEYGFESSAAIPIVHEGTIYGALNVYADRPNAFEGQERTVISQLGEVVGHAIAAAERERALLGDEVVELEFHVHRMLDDLGIDERPPDPIRFDHAVPLDEGEYLIFGSSTHESIPTLRAFAEASPHADDVTFTEEAAETTFQIRMVDSPLLQMLSAHGGNFEGAVIEDRSLNVKLQLPPGIEVRKIISKIHEAYPGAEMLRRQQVSQEENDPVRLQQLILENLTACQRRSLETAYHAGFFEWPRNASGEDIAETMGVTPPTFHQHLRKAERKVFDAVLASTL